MRIWIIALCLLPVSIVALEPNFILFKDNTKPAETSSLPDGTDENTTISEYVPTSKSITYYGFDGNQTITVSIDENGTRTISGDHVLAEPVYGDDGNISYYQPRNTNIMELFKTRDSKRGPASVLSRLSQSEVAKDVVSKRGDALKSDYVINNYADSKEANITKAGQDLTAMLVAAVNKPNTIKCFAKRKLVPAYKCPIQEYTTGATVGGNIHDSLEVAKAECDSFCISPSLGCRSASSGYQSTETIGQTISFTSGSSTGNEDLLFDINTRLRLDEVKFTININYTELGEELRHSRDGVPLEISMSVFHLPLLAEEGASMEPYIENEPWRMEDDFAEVSLHMFDGSKRGLIRFTPPRLRQIGTFEGMELSDVVDTVSIEGVDLIYAGNQYYFCGMSQIVQDPSKDCAGGKIFSVHGSDGDYLICRRGDILHGPESEYGAFYTEAECNQACRTRAECVETYVDYPSMAGNERYNVTVGCVDDPQNTACSVNECERLFMEHDMPLNETVYDLHESSRQTVLAGVKIDGVARPKVDIAAEYAAAMSAAPDAYESVFTQSMKDAAYDNMIRNGKFVYSKYPISQPTDIENAVRIVDPINLPGSDYTTMNQDLELYWKLKPSSVDVGNGTPYYIYAIARVDNVYVPESGTFTESVTTTDPITGIATTQQMTTNQPSRSYKDSLYLSMDDVGDYHAFYEDSYWQVFNEGSGWNDNQMHHETRFVAYDSVSDSLLISSPTIRPTHMKTMTFDGQTSYYEFKLISNPQATFEGTPGAMIRSQEVVNQSALPIKHFVFYDAESAASISNYYFYGIYSLTRLTNEQIVSLIDDAHLVYNGQLYKSNKTEIYGDGHIRSGNVRIIMKGTMDHMTVDADINPSIDEEDKEAVVFQFLYE